MFELGGAALVTFGGWMGGTLVYRNQIGVDHRYANAGKWHEAPISGRPGQTITLDGAEELEPGQMWLLRWTMTGLDRSDSRDESDSQRSGESTAQLPEQLSEKRPRASNEKRSDQSNQRRLVLARTDDGFAAFDDHCTHRGGSLAGGVLICGIVQCPWHGSQFEVKTGQVKSGPAKKKPIATCRAELRDGKVRLTLPATSSESG